MLIWGTSWKKSGSKLGAFSSKGGTTYEILSIIHNLQGDQILNDFLHVAQKQLKNLIPVSVAEWGKAYISLILAIFLFLANAFLVVENILSKEGFINIFSKFCIFDRMASFMIAIDWAAD